MWYVLSHHGTAGMSDSYGYSEVVQSDREPRGSQTLTVSGPYETEVQAQHECDTCNAEQDATRIVLEDPDQALLREAQEIVRRAYEGIPEAIQRLKRHYR